MSVPTISEWLNILEITAQIILVPPFYENFGKRLIKSPKLYFLDSGLACHLLGVESEKTLNRSPFLGPIFEGFVASEILKVQAGAGRRRELYYFRDQQGLEVDFLVPAGHRQLLLVEAKASRTVMPEMAAPLQRLARGIVGYDARGFLVHRPSPQRPPTSALRPGIKALTVDGLLAALSRS